MGTETTQFSVSVLCGLGGSGPGLCPIGVRRRHLFPEAAHFLPLDPGSVVGSAGRERPTSAVSKEERSPVLSDGPAACRASECSGLQPSLSLLAAREPAGEGTAPPGPAHRGREMALDLGGCNPSTPLGLFCSKYPPSFPKPGALLHGILWLFPLAWIQARRAHYAALAFTFA